MNQGTHHHLKRVGSARQSWQGLQSWFPWPVLRTPFPLIPFLEFLSLTGAWAARHTPSDRRVPDESVQRPLNVVAPEAGRPNGVCDRNLAHAVVEEWVVIVVPPLFFSELD